ncbi:MAG: SPOR domain-containing protein [Rhodothermales bacterium]|nr:SPOR domain-containing protein [Rhodothermales bacterium]
MPVRLLAVLLVVCVSGIVACSGPREAEQPVVEAPAEPDPAHPEYETFDPAPYDAEPEAEPVEVEHDVPEALMAGTIVVEPTEGPRTVPGFRIQVFSSEEKAAAERVREQTLAWWRIAQRDPGADVLPRELPLEIAFIRPYYRVRLGAFEHREEAEAALPMVRRRFGEAFIVPDTITLGGG